MNGKEYYYSYRMGVGTLRILHCFLENVKQQSVWDKLILLKPPIEWSGGSNHF